MGLGGRLNGNFMRWMLCIPSAVRVVLGCEFGGVTDGLGLAAQCDQRDGGECMRSTTGCEWRRGG